MLSSFKGDVSVEERGGELEEGEGETGRLRECRLVAELEDILLDFDGEEGEGTKVGDDMWDSRGCCGLRETED